MNAGQVIELAKEWVAVEGQQLPGFCGAHLMGALTSMPKDSPFPAYRDVDLQIVLREGPRQEPQNIFYKGLLLEYGSFGIERYQSPEIVLADPALACHLATDSILSDPFGLLAGLQPTVIEAYAQRRWILARCAAAKERFWRGVEAVSRASTPVEAILQGITLVAGLTGFIAVANLKPPTYRRCLILTKLLLEVQGRGELQEDMLKLLRYAHLTRLQVEAYLQDCIETFDKAVEVTQTPVPFSYKLRPHLRPYVVEGTWEMIHEGYHREAMFWVGGFLLVANMAIQKDAPEAEKGYFQTKVNRLLEGLEWNTSSMVSLRLQQAIALGQQIFKEVDDRFI